MCYLKIFVGLIFCSLIFTVPALGQNKKAPPPPGGFPENQGLPKNSKAPNFKYKSLNGKEIELEDYRGQYVLIDFWGTWCKPCLEEIPYLKEAYLKYGSEIKFISIAVYDNKQSVSNYANKNDIEWTQIVLPSGSKNRPEILDDYDVYLFPSVFLIDPHGLIQNGAQSRKVKNKLSGNQLIKTLEKVLTNH